MLVSCSVPQKVEIQEVAETPQIEDQEEQMPVKEPEVTITPDKQGMQSKEFNWKYKKEEYTIKIPLYENLNYFYAKQPRFITYKDSLPEDWEAQIYKNTLNLDDMEGFTELIDFFSGVRQEKELSDDDFVELITSFVQNIPYDYASLDDPNSQLKYPYQTLFDQKGVCSDKTLVAAKLLNYYGYGVALFLFDDENHMSLGIQCPKESSSYLSGYCYVETTAAEAVGVAPELLAGNLSLKSQPQIISISKGKQYGRAEENIKKEVKRREFCRQLENAEKEVKEKEIAIHSLSAIFERSHNAIDYANYRDSYTIYSRTFEKYEQILAGCKGYEYSPRGFY